MALGSEAYPEFPELTYNNVRYGMLVIVLNDSGYHSGCKVHFFNKKGVLIGNMYEFLPYERLRVRLPDEYHKDRNYPLYFMGEMHDKIKRYLFIKYCNLITRMIGFSEEIMRKH